MLFLTDKITIWPDPRDLMMAGSKLFLESIIGKVAASMQLLHPQAVVVEPSVSTVESIATGKSACVLKRDFSSHGKHVFTKHTPNAVNQFVSRLAREKEVYDECKLFPRPLWFIQPYNPSIINLGEIRVYLVNGILFNSIVTSPRQNPRQNVLNIVEPVLFTPLSQLRYELADIFPD